MSKPSVVDVARMAGVGASTVSRVLNNHPNISEHTRQKVLQAVETVGYTPNLNARSLRSGQTHAISMLLPMTGTAFYDALLSAIHGVLEEHDLDLALFPLMGARRIRRFREPGALLYRADGLLIASQDPELLYLGRIPFNKPVVLVDAHHPQYHSIHFNNMAAGRMAGELALGSHLPIILLDVARHPGDLPSPVFEERRLGVVDALRRQGVMPRLHLTAEATVEGGREAGQHLLDRWSGGPFFLVALSDDLALGVQRHLLQAGRRSGEDYQLIGFDGSDAARDADLSSIAQPVSEMGHRAAAVLVQAMQGELPSVVHQVFTPQLRAAGSTRPLNTLMSSRP